MQKTNFSRITYQLNNLFLVFLVYLRTKSIGLISVLTGYFCSNFLTKFISEGKNELIMVPIIIVFIEFIIRIKPPQVQILLFMDHY